MSLTVEQLLTDARRLSTRLKDHDTSADNIITRSQEVLREVEAMRQYQENIENLNEVAHNRPRAHLVLGIQQENSHIRSLQHENKELRAALEEHQSALELIMSKYREHVTSMIKSSGKVEYSRDPSTNIIQKQTEKICEMAGVMKGALRLDEEKEVETQQLIARLFTENKGLRELLGISAKNHSLPALKKVGGGVDQGVQTEGRGVDLQVTLPMPAPPPRLNRGMQGGLVKPTSTEEDNDGRLSVSPSLSASESDETSDDDSVKFDTIKLSRRKTVLPTTIKADTSNLSSTKPAADASNLSSTKPAVDTCCLSSTKPATDNSNLSSTKAAVDTSCLSSTKSAAADKSNLSSTKPAADTSGLPVTKMTANTSILQGSKPAAAAEATSDLDYSNLVNNNPLTSPVAEKPNKDDHESLKLSDKLTKDKVSPSDSKTEVTIVSSIELSKSNLSYSSSPKNMSSPLNEDKTSLKSESLDLKCEGPPPKGERSPIKNEKKPSIKSSKKDEQTLQNDDSSGKTATPVDERSPQKAENLPGKNRSYQQSNESIAVTNCASIVNDIVVDSVNSSKR